MGHIRFCSFLLLCLGSLTSFASLPENYQALSADEKQDVLWQKVCQSHQENPLPDLDTGGFSAAYGLFKRLFNLKPSFDHQSDELPKGRQKVLHPNGSVAKVSWVSTNSHPFSGLYASGAVGIARLSLAQAPSDDSFVPGMAIKFLLPGTPSLNLHVINNLEGQGGNWNFFATTFSNQIPHPKGWLLSGIEKIFEWTRSPANDLPVNHLAETSEMGEVINDAVSPEQLFFEPSERVRNLIDEKSREDFRTSLAQVSAGPIYEVYGLYQGERIHVATVVLESELLASEYGDQKLFFQHQR